MRQPPGAVEAFVPQRSVGPPPEHIDAPIPERNGVGVRAERGGAEELVRHPSGPVEAFVPQRPVRAPREHVNVPVPGCHWVWVGA